MLENRRLACDIVTPVPGTDLLTVGEAFEDLIFLDLDRLPRPGEEVKTSRFVATVGGGAVITAVAAARLGVSVRILSGLSDAACARLADRVGGGHQPETARRARMRLRPPSRRG